MAVRDQGQSTSDLIVREFDPSYNYDAALLSNASGAEQSLQNCVGYPVKKSGADWVVVLALDEAATEGLLIEAKAKVLADGTKTQRPMTALVRGPATINVEGIATADPAGTNYTVATIVTALEALSPPLVVKDVTGSLVVKPLHDGAFPE